ncbi:MAG TPA: hypothetical protein VGS58_22595 [Candidatus Sulfopaludibacter sp.]|nr:hypothetical protein [Candidatus Sulfopaludibacter sp.]
MKGALCLTDDIEADRASESRPYPVGPMVELRLPFGLGIEAEALYSRFGYSSSGSNFSSSFSIRARANSWEFPVLAKYHRRLVFFDAGVAPRRMSGEFTSTVFSINPLTYSWSYSSVTGNTTYAATVGFVFGGGVEFSAGRIHIAPEVR